MSGRWRWLLGTLCGVALTVSGVRAFAAADRGGSAVKEQEAHLLPRVTPEMERYSYTRYALYFVDVAWSAALLFGIFRSGLSARLREAAVRRSRRRFVQVLVYYLFFSALYGLARLPLDFYSGWLLEQRYHLSTQPLWRWAWDGVKGYLIGAVLAPPILYLLYLCLARAPRRWWIGFWLASIPIAVFLVLIAPVAIDPLFHKFEPLRNTELREKILALARRAGIAGGRVFQVDMSAETRKMNAYVYGIGPTTRIVLWDTTLAGLKEDEILSVTAHEMGHYVLGHVYWGLGLAIGGTLALLLALDRAGRFVVRSWGPRCGVRELSDLASLPLLLGLASLLGFVAAPAANAVSRTMERQADDFELQITHNGHAAARSFVRLSEQNLSLPNPPPAIVFWLFSHPPLAERIHHALAYDERRTTNNNSQDGPDETG